MCACCLALAGQQQHMQGRRGAVLGLSVGYSQGTPCSCRVSACTGVSLVQECVSHCRAGPRGVSALCLTRSDRDLPTRLLLPRSSFSCGGSQPSTASESPSKAEQGVVCAVIGVGRIKSDFVSALLTGGAHKDQ